MRGHGFGRNEGQKRVRGLEITLAHMCTVVTSRSHYCNTITTTTTPTRTELLSTLCPAASSSSSVSSTSLPTGLSRRQEQRQQQRERQRHERQQHGEEGREGAQRDSSVKKAQGKAEAPLDIASASESARRKGVEEEGG